MAGITHICPPPSMTGDYTALGRLADAEERLAESERVRRQLAEALRSSRAYVEEPGSPGTQIETTEVSAAMSADLLVKVDAALAANDALEEKT